MPSYLRLEDESRNLSVRLSDDLPAGLNPIELGIKFLNQPLNQSSACS